MEWKCNLCRPQMPNDINQSDLENDILPGVSRAAILLLAMGADNAGRIIQHLSDEEVSSLLEQWETQVLEHHETLQAQEVVPKAATTVAMSLDGVMLGMKPERKAKTS